MLSDVYALCHKQAECNYDKCCYAECRFTEFRRVSLC
jgi:hypothetical protein